MSQFREQAIQARRRRALGSVRIGVPRSLQLSILCGAGISILFFSMVAFMPYSRHIAATGRIATSSTGFVAKVMVTEAAVGVVRSGAHASVYFRALVGSDRRQFEGVVSNVQYVPEQAGDARLYPVTIKLDDGLTQMDGAISAAEVGMVVDARILIGRRRMFEWVFASALNR